MLEEMVNDRGSVLELPEVREGERGENRHRHGKRVGHPSLDPGVHLFLRGGLGGVRGRICGRIVACMRCGKVRVFRRAVGIQVALMIKGRVANRRHNYGGAAITARVLTVLG